MKITFTPNEKTFFVDLILYHISSTDCFGKKMSLTDILKFITHIADQVFCQKIYLMDDSYIPLPHFEPDFKLPLLLATGKTLYMKKGFFYFPYDFIELVDHCLQNNLQKRDRILCNILVLNQTFSELIRWCSNVVKTSEIIPSMTRFGDMSLQELASFMLTTFFKKDVPSLENEKQTCYNIQN